MDYSIQLSNVYDMFEADPDTTLKKVAEIGYTCVEFCSFAGKTMEELKAMLDKYGLKVTGAHIPTFMLKDDILEQTIADMKTLGNKNIVIPCVGGKLDDAIALINRIQPIIEANGMSLHLHNHSGEFAPNADGIVPYDAFIERTNLNFQVDILYAANGGHDPLTLIKKLGKRVSLLHMKDGIAQPYDPFIFGKGELDLVSIHKYAKENDIAMIVEHSSKSDDIYGENKACLDYLKSLD